MNACESKVDFLMAYRTEALGEDKRRSIAAHLEECAPCRGLEARLAESLSLADAPPRRAPPKLLSQLAAAEKPKPVPPPEDLDPSMRVSVARSCGYCRGDLGEARVHCAECLARYHEDCFQELGRCGVMGCESTRVLKPAAAAAPRRRSRPGALRVALGILAGSVIAATGGKLLLSSKPAPKAARVSTAPRVADTPYLGVTLVRGEGFGSYRAVWVAPNGPAARAGLRKGDAVRLFGSGALRASNSERYELEDFAIGSEVELRFQRDGRVVIELVTVEPEPRIAYWGLTTAFPSSADAGEFEGLEVKEVDFGGPAYKAGLKVGDRLLRAAGERVSRREPLPLDASRPGDEVSLVLRRGQRTLETLLVAEAGPCRTRLGLELDEPELRVSWVQPDSPASEIGLKVGDRLYSLQGNANLSLDRVERILARLGLGRAIASVAFQGSVDSGPPTFRQIGLTIPEWDPSSMGPNAYRRCIELGLELLGDPGGQRRVVEITDVTKGGIADRAGLRAGDRILGFNGWRGPRYQTALGALDSLPRGEEITLKCSRAGAAFDCRLVGE